MVTASSTSLLGRRLRSRREELQLSLEKVGVAIGIDESSSRARISRYELGVHEPALPIAKKLADVIQVPLAYLFCEDDDVARMLLALHKLSHEERERLVNHILLHLLPTERTAGSKTAQT
jgi:transcriptional regulator with XRE-family HTH domain